VPISTQKKLQQLGWYFWLFLIVLSPASTKVAGAAWGMAIVWSFWIARTTPKLEAHHRGVQALYLATTLILWSFIIAFVLRTIGQAYWWDAWEHRHFDIRMLLTAIALHIFARRVRPSPQARNALIIAIALSSISALYVAFNLLRGLSIPTTIIPWAFGMVLYAVVLASVRLTTDVTAMKQRILTQWLSLIGILCLLTAISMSGVRGTYFAFAWVIGVVLYGVARAVSVIHLNNKYVWLSCLALVISLGVLIKTVPQIYQTPQQRITLAIAEIGGFLTDERNTSVGLRLHFAEKGTAAVLANPWVGYGIQQRETLVTQWGHEVDPSLTGLKHAHNEYLNAVLDHGLLGGGATLAYLLGLMLATVAVWRTNIALSVALAGIGFATATTFLTNANTLHNFTSVLLGLALIYAMVIYSTRDH
jgi:hypothetical protein